jgi:hypothetical protein
LLLWAQKISPCRIFHVTKIAASGFFGNIIAVVGAKNFPHAEFFTLQKLRQGEISLRY